MTGVSFTILIAMAPAPPEIVNAVREIHVETTTSGASVFRMVLGIAQTDTGDWSVLQFDPFRPLVPVSIRIQAGGLVPQSVINGYVTAHSVAFGDEPGQSSMEVIGMDATALMNLEEKVRQWPNLPDSAIAAAIFGQYTVVPMTQPTSPVLVEPEGTTTQRGSDIRFLRRLAARNGFECYVQPEPFTGVDQGIFRPPQTTGLPQAVLSVNMGDQTNVNGFHVRYDMLRPTTALAAGIDPHTKSPQLGLAPVSLQVPMGLEGTLMRLMPPPVALPAETGLMRTADLQTAAQSIVDRSTFAVVAEGEVGADVGVLRPGAPISIRGAGREYSGSYYVTRVSHFVAPDSYTQQFEAQRTAVGLTGAEMFAPM